MKRGRKTGQIINPRNERGWMIPKLGTVRRRVYDALMGGMGWAEIGMCPRCFSTHKQAIVTPDKFLEWRRASA